MTMLINTNCAGSGCQWNQREHGEQLGCQGQCYHDNAQLFLCKMWKKERVDTWRAWWAKRALSFLWLAFVIGAPNTECSLWLCLKQSNTLNYFNGHTVWTTPVWSGFWNRERETEKERWKGLTQEGVGIMKAWNSTAEKSSGKVPPNFPVP